MPSAGTSTVDQTNNALELNEDLVLGTSSLTLNPILCPLPLLPLGLRVFYRAGEPPDDPDGTTAQPWEARAGRCGSQGASPALLTVICLSSFFPGSFCL